MEIKQNLTKVVKIKADIKYKHKRIKELQELSKLKTNKVLIGEFDSVIEALNKINTAILQTKEIPDAQKEQVMLRSNARTALTLRGIKNNIIASQKRINELNEEIAYNNNEIKKLINKPKEGKHAQVI